MKLFAIFSALVISLGTCLRRDQYYAQAHLLDVPTPSATTLPSTNPTAQTVTPSPQTSQQQPAKPKVDQSKYKSFEECCAGNGNFQCGRMFKDCCKTKPNSKTNNTCDGAVVKNCPAGQYFDQCDFLKK
jgi:hypothetical protein